jgi:hypothetical protein
VKPPTANRNGLHNREQQIASADVNQLVGDE